MHPERVSHNQAEEATVKMGDVTFSVPIRKILVIEKLNNMRIKVYGYDREVFPLPISTMPNEDHHHYCLIRNMSRLLGDLSNYQRATFYCHRFSKERVLKEHLTYCKDHCTQKIKLPEECNSILKFANINYQSPILYVIYADIEALIQPITTVEPNTDVSFIEKTSQHLPCGYPYVIVGLDGKSV